MERRDRTLATREESRKHPAYLHTSAEKWCEMVLSTSSPTYKRRQRCQDRKWGQVVYIQTKKNTLPDWHRIPNLKVQAWSCLTSKLAQKKINICEKQKITARTKKTGW
mmetsp:Transcript_10392/g.63413  ORF Transcript_10392/g.63413 Transcript_10392/m.63413 type:complete len:108 (+) Transcript_10392:475-798(+)